MQDTNKKPFSDAYQEYMGKDWMSLHMQNWRSWGSWFSWGSPVGLGLFFVLISVSLYLLHLAGLVG